MNDEGIQKSAVLLLSTGTKVKSPVTPGMPCRVTVILPSIVVWTIATYLEPPELFSQPQPFAAGALAVFPD